MTIYDLTQAVRRYRRPVVIASTVLILLVLTMTFQIKDGRIAFRSGLDYESSVKIAVVSSGTDSLIASDGSGQDLAGIAELYASLLSSPEAAEWIAETNGYEPLDTVDASTQLRSTVIDATVLAPTSAQAKASALSTFDWLNLKLTQPITTSDFPTPTTTRAPVVFNGAVQSQINVEIDGALSDTSDDLFLRIVPDSSLPFTFPISRNAGSVVRSGAILDPLMTLLVSLVSGSDDVLDTVRVAPPAPPRTADAAPKLGIVILNGAINRNTVESGGSALTLDTDEIILEWQEGTVAAEPAEEAVVSVKLALLTTEPGVTTSGGRRGPILFVSTLLVGFILILAAVVVADTWRRDRDARLPAGAQDNRGATGAADVQDAIGAAASTRGAVATSAGSAAASGDEPASTRRRQPAGKDT